MPSQIPDLDDAAAWSAYRRTHMVDLTDRLILRNGEVVTLRVIRPDDVERLQQFHARLSPDTIVMRYFRAAPVLYAPDARRLTHLDYDNRMAFVATTGIGADERIVGVVRYERTSATEGELAFVIEDWWQGQGISTQILARLLPYARRHGFERMTAITLSTNTRMRAVMRHASYAITSHYEEGCTVLTLDLTKPYVVGN